MTNYSGKGKVIFHIDMNAFFCTVAEILNPSLRGKAFAIGREGTYKGVISTASYEARKYGIGSAMSQLEAYKKLPSLIIINGDYQNYVKYHKKFVDLILEYTKIVEVASIDEVYADMTEVAKIKHPIVLAKEIQYRLIKEHNLKCSIGIGPTLFYAKMASDMKKPMGITVLRIREKEKMLYPVSVKDIYGIGKKTYPTLIQNGIETIGDFMNPENKELILDLIGENSYNYVISHVNGESSNIVDPNRYSDAQSISTSQTFDVFKVTKEDLVYESRAMIRSLLKRINKYDSLCKTIILTLRDSDFHTISRRETLDNYTDDFYVVSDVIIDLIDKYFIDGKSYRLLGVGLSNLIKKEDLPKEYNLFTVMDISEKELRINEMVNDFKNKFGDKVINWKGGKNGK